MSLFLSCYSTNLSNLRQYNLSKFKHLLLKSKSQKQHVFRQFCQEKKSKAPVFVPFQEEIKRRRNEAKRSVIVQVQSAKSCSELYSYCSSFGNVRQMFHYSIGVEPLHFIIVEFKKEADVAAIQNASAHVDDTQVMPVHSQFLWFRAPGKHSAKLKKVKNVQLVAENGTTVPTDVVVKTKLRNVDNISEQIRCLYEVTKLNDVGTRLRFLTARQIESCVSGMFPNAIAFPFGSSVNGCGKMGCDLDLVLRIAEHQQSQDSRLVFHAKACSGSERTTSQRNMEAIGDIIQLFLPGCAQVRRILQARVPIIKYYQHLTNVECDLSMSNMSGVYMSDFLYLMGAIDDRVRPLIFAVRKWASEVGLTNSSPGRWISNFSLTLLVLYFLQQPLRSGAVLPPMNTLTKSAEPTDKYITEDGINCTFLRDITKLHHKTQNLDSLQDLLCEFFEFYSQFDFSTKAVCLNEGIALTKPEYTSMYIINPLERGLNVSKNVSLEEVERFKVEVRNAAWTLQSQEHKTAEWGLLALFNGKKKASVLNFTRHDRLMDVKALFDEETDEATAFEFKNEAVEFRNEAVEFKNEAVEFKNEAVDFENEAVELKNDVFKNETVEFKNEEIRKQVADIKKETREKIKELNNLERLNSQG